MHKILEIYQVEDEHASILLVDYLVEEINPNWTDTIDYITIASLGDAIDFGND